MGERRGSLVSRRQVPGTMTKLKIPPFVSPVKFGCDGGQATWSEAGPDLSDNVDVQEVEEEGKELFEHFVVEQIRREGLAAPVECLISAR